ncbi:MAG: alanine--tRNA ligase [Rhodothalassiaceae bacterium]
MTTPFRTNDIRRSFLDYFAEKEHEIVPSAPLVPFNDPTLLFTNAGMVPFKNVFTGIEKRPYVRAASSQKCVRAGGKHNDLDNVGYTARHHTFFEMLGNFSFGDYFKEKAISYAWELITSVYGLPRDRLLVTVYHDDEEAFSLWRRIAGLPEERILRIATSDNFWSMGDTGPCGPCSEIFYDHGADIPGGPPGSADQDGDRFIEIWNLVFMQFDSLGNGERVPLPKPSIDTGMGLERIAAVLQGVHDNYDIDLFRRLIAASVDLTGIPAEGAHRASHRVIADHLRAMSFLIADGVSPSNEGRGYVLRRIMRRAMRHAHMLGAKDALLWRLVPALIAEMGGHFAELSRAEDTIAETLRSEEERFRSMLERGLRLLDEELGKLPAGAALPGDVAFRLYDTYGFPLDLTEDALRQQGRKVDRAGFEAAMAEQKRKARAAWAGSGQEALSGLWYDIRERVGATEFLGYGTTTGEGQVLALVRDGAEISRAGRGETVSLIVNQTPFYGESGGQVGDSGHAHGKNGARLVIGDTKKLLGDLHVHEARIEEGEIAIGDNLSLVVDAERRARIRANHSATHLLHAALRRLLGPHVTQKGSLVDADRLRFDFAHPKAMTPQEIGQIEAIVNAEIRRNADVATRLMSYDEALEAGAMALFGEKYGDEVRVLAMGEAEDGKPFSVELCGGTHVRRLGDIALFKIVSESAVASGIRRIEALTGEAARQYYIEEERRLQEAAAALKTSPAELPVRVAQLSEQVRTLERALSDARRSLALGGGAESKGPAVERIGDLGFLGQILEGVSPKDLRGIADEARKKIGSGVVALLAINDGKAALLVALTKDLVDRMDAVALIRSAVPHIGGKGGGGRPDLAQAGGPDPAGAEAALDAIRAALSAGGN